MQRGSLATRLCHSVALSAILAAASPALAQPTNQPPATVETVQPGEPPADEADDRVVVTGTRLTNQYSSPSPMDVIVADQAAAQGIADVAALLRSSTVAAGSPQITAISSTAFVQDGGFGAESISLRGLGANRTLVLLDGRRAGPAGTRGSVGAFDFNVIPLSAIDRVEILKEGASSIYGSDAVAGVINIITRKDSGLDFDAFYSAPLAGGGDEKRFNVTWGEDYGNLRFRVTGDYHKQEELQRGDRDFFQCGTAYVFNDAGQRQDIIDPRTGDYTCETDSAWGHVWFYDRTQPGSVTRPWQEMSQLIQFDYDNNLSKYLPGFGPTASYFAAPPGWFPVGYGEIVQPGYTPDPFYGPSALNSDAVLNQFHPFQNRVSLSPAVERITAFASGELDISDSMTLYGEALLNRRTSERKAYRQFWTYQYVYNYGGGVFGGDPLALDQGWECDFCIYSPLAITDHASETVVVDYMRAVAGAKGDLPFGWTFDASLQFSRSDGDYKDHVIFADAVTDYEFRNSTCAGTTTRYRGAPCVDINWFDPNFLAGEIPDAYRAFLFGNAKGNTIYEQMSAEAYVTGTLFDLPAGPVGVVFGALYQEDSIRDTPDQIIQDAEAWGDATAGITEGKDKTKAVYAELAVPILADAPFAEEISLNLSGRYNDVDSYGAKSTWKAGLNWEITPEFRVRASQGTSFRSPALFELFLANETGFQRQSDIDVCVDWGANLASGGITQRIADNCAADGLPSDLSGIGATATVLSSGGFGTLEAETSESKSFGVIWTPEFIDLQVSLDYFDIDVDDEVTKLGANNIVLGCYSSLNFATEPLCDLFDRAPAGSTNEFVIQEVVDNFLNISSQTNRGIDLDALYRHDLGWGDLSVHAQVSRQLEDELVLLPTSAPLDFNGWEGDPKWVGNFDATLSFGEFEFFYGVRYVGETSNREHYGNQPQTYRGAPVNYVLETPELWYHSASVSIEPDEGLQVRFGISNLFDQDPPQVTGELSGEYQTIGNVVVSGGNYDFFGRTAYLNVSKSF